MITSCMKLCLVLFVGYILLYIFFVSLSNISEHSDKHQQNLNTRTDVFTDYNCITTLDKIIRKDEEDNFIIPPNDALVQLPIHVLDCLYHRYTTTLQIYCSKRTRHGSLSNGWTICTDGCYRPTVDDHFHVVSSHNDSSSLNDKSVKDVYKSMVHHYTTDLKAADTGQTLSFSSLEDLNESQRTKDVLKVDVGQYTRETVDSILKSGALNSIQQLSLRTQYGDIERTRIDYIPALIHLRQFYDLGFRIYWYRLEWNCVMKVNKNRTNCVYLDMAYKKCRESNGTMEHNHLQIADNSYLKSLRRMALEDVYHKYLASTQTYCKEIIRLGGDRGGWDLCHDVKYRPKYPCLVYSFGINWNFRFDDAIGGAYGCEVHAFDPSMNSTDFQRNAQVKFYNLGLAAMTYTDEKRKWKMSSLLDIRKKLGHETRKLDVIKIDIEWSEWLAVPEMIQSGALRDVTQLYIEFHSPGTLKHLQILKLLYNEGFRIFWYNQNVKCPLDKKFVQYSICNEIYFLRE